MTQERSAVTGPGTSRPAHLLAFLALSHGWTWAFWGIAAVLAPSVWDWPAVVFFYVGGAGVVLGGVVVTRVLHGASGLRELGRRIVDPRRVPAAWWATIFLFYPLVAFVSAGIATLFGGVEEPLDFGTASSHLADPVGLATMVGFVMLVGPLPEEIGWRGFLQDHIQARGRTALAAALLVGLAWWSWHLPLFVLPGYFDAFGRTSPTPLDFLLNILPAAILYAWVYIGTNRSVLAVIIFHFMENFTSEFLGLAENVRPWRFGVLALAVIVVVARTGPRTLRRGGTIAALAVTLLGAMAVPGNAVAQPVLAELQVEFYPTSSIAATLDDGPSTEASVWVVSGSALIPFAYRSDRTVLASSLSGSLVAMKVRPLDPDPTRDEPLEALYDFDLNLLAVRQLSERWELTLVASPGIASDLRRLDGDHLTLQGAALATQRVRPSLAWGLGISVTNALGASTVVPVASLGFEGNRARVDVLLPARASFLWIPSERVEVGLAADLSGNAYGLGLDGELQDPVVRYSVVNAGPAIRFRPVAGLRLSLSAGASFRRRLEIEGAEGNRIQDARLRRGWTVGAGVAWLLPTDRQ